ncbi:MAG: hypothetical protein ACI4E5_12540 [Suilimivivens sp.]
MKQPKKFYKSRKLQAWAIIIISVLTEIVISLWYNFSYNVKAYFPEILYYISQFITSIFVISGVVIAVWQYYLASKSARNELEIKQVQRAIDLSEYYKDNILKYAPAISYIFDEIGVSPILKKLKLTQLNNFDKNELEDLLSPNDIDILKNSQYNSKFFEAVVNANAIYNLNMKFLTKKIKQQKDGKEIDAIAIDNNSIAISFFSDLLNKILNNMEFFALHFSHNTADESVVYQSLHQSYFELIQLLYYYISVQNENPSYKFYTNVIELFHKWMNAKDKQKNEFSKNSNSIQRNGTKIDN